MLRFITVGLVVLAGVLGGTGTSQGQVFVQAPFVRVTVGGPGASGVGVRAPFVNLWIPSRNYPQPVKYVPPPPPEPRVAHVRPETPPPQATGETPLTLGQFAESFQAQSGRHKVTLINPVTNSPAPVAFTLPEGTPRRVAVNKERITFVYGFRHWVRITFDKDGAIVSSR
ncbi:MAG TPA: hypothetical protein VG099_29085 [Gemmataceae bacterium]|jgi:hypothetical protein|nr:hypothetical protein [Gemmataceae bacterium]